MNGVGALETIWQDTVYALRTMRNQPVFAATAVITLALAIGGNTAMFTVIRAVLLQPLQYREPDRLVRVADGATPSRFAEMKAAHSFTEIGAFTGVEDLALSGGAEPEVLKAVHVSASFLRILAVDPLRGRGFRADEDASGGPPVAMISEELWQLCYSTSALPTPRHSPASPRCSCWWRWLPATFRHDGPREAILWLPCEVNRKSAAGTRLSYRSASARRGQSPAPSQGASIVPT